MKQAKISDLKNNLSRYLDLVREGETIQVLDRNIPIALITSISESKGILRKDRIRQMERKGLIRIGNPALLKSILEARPPGRKTGALKALLQEREEGR
jgi:prevent-host-death family protein